MKNSDQFIAVSCLYNGKAAFNNGAPISLPENRYPISNYYLLRNFLNFGLSVLLSG